MPAAWQYGLVGGLMIGAAAAVLLWVNGRVAGVSGIATGAVNQRGEERVWRVVWLAALVTGGLAATALDGGLAFEPRDGFPQGLLVLAGLLVGFGTRYGSGCTSGHGICGISRLSPRSLVATGVFMGVGMLAVFAVRHLWGAV